MRHDSNGKMARHNFLQSNKRVALQKHKGMSGPLLTEIIPYELDAVHTAKRICRQFPPPACPRLITRNLIT